MNRFSITITALTLGFGVIVSHSASGPVSEPLPQALTASNDTRGQVVMRKMPPDPPKPGDDKRPKRESFVLPIFGYAAPDHLRPA